MPFALQVLVERYGLDGRAPRSLLEVARSHGLTRLGLRRIEGQALAALLAPGRFFTPRHGRARSRIERRAQA